MIKKRKYWPTLVSGNVISKYFETKVVGKIDDIYGMLSGIEYFIWETKEPDYATKIVGDGGTSISKGCTEVCHKW